MTEYPQSAHRTSPILRGIGALARTIVCGKFRQILLCAGLLGAQLAQAQAVAPQGSDVARPSRSSERVRSTLLHGLDNSLQELAAKVSPAVVQIAVSGYRSAEDREHGKSGKMT